MFFLFSKLLTFLIKPFSYAVVLLIWSFVTRSTKLKVPLLRISLAVLLVFSNPLMVNFIFKLVEGNPTPFSSIQETYTVGVVLTGVADVFREPKDRTYFNKGADRITHALQLYKMGKIKNILITGENGQLRSDGTSEAAQLKQFLLVAGVKEQHIFLEEKAKNTHQNAVFTRDLLDSIGLSKSRVLLITSAFHMHRASACFQKVNIAHDTFRVDFYSPPQLLSWQPDRWLFPSADALEKWNKLFKEGFGLLAYLLVGYI